MYRRPNNQNGFAQNSFANASFMPTSTAPQQQAPQGQYQQPTFQQPVQNFPQQASYQQPPQTRSAPPAQNNGYQPSGAPVSNAQRNGNARPAAQNRPAETPPAPNADFINSKIAVMDGKDKKLDFSDSLIMANPEDYANVHGIGGKGHAPNSAIALTLCDYSKGTGDKSVNVKVNLDVRYIDYLLCVVSGAVNGTLGLASQLRSVKDFATTNGILIGWLQSNHQPTMQELAGLQQTMCNGLVAQDPEGKQPCWSDSFQKNNPYKTENRNSKEFAPVSIFSIAYDPTRNYPWTIKVTNCMAPLIRQANGATAHNAKEAVDKKEVVFSAKTQDLFESLSSVDHYIRLWERRMFSVINAQCQKREQQKQEFKKNERRG